MLGIWGRRSGALCRARTRSTAARLAPSYTLVTRNRSNSPNHSRPFGSCLTDSRTGACFRGTNRRIGTGALLRQSAAYHAGLDSPIRAQVSPVPNYEPPGAGKFTQWLVMAFVALLAVLVALEFLLRALGH